jgi:hypothetical protein
MKINLIYKITYSLLAFIFIPIWFILAPNEKEITYEQYQEDVIYVEVGHKIPINHEDLKKKYNYDDIQMMNIIRNNTLVKSSLSDDNEQMFVENNRSEFIASRHGLAIYLLLLYKDNRIVHTINLGFHLQYVEFDEHDDEWVPLTQVNFISSLETNPSGKFYLSEDISLIHRYRLIERFSGILYNPYKHVLSNVNDIENELNQGLFDTLDNAIIDGIIIERSSLVRDDQSNKFISSQVGFIAGVSLGSFVSNVSVTGYLSYNFSDSSGGLVGSSTCSIFRNVSFTGSINSSNSTGGILGSNMGFRGIFTLLGDYITTHVTTIENGYVNADLSNSYSLAGLIGTQGENTRIDVKSVYLIGTIDRSKSDSYSRVIGYLSINSPWSRVLSYEYEYAYTTYPRITDKSEVDGEGVVFITIDQLYSDIPLEGLESFIFTTDDIPRLPYWRIGS